MKQFISIFSFLFLAFVGYSQEAVDLGLSVKWATCNVGANTPEEYGNYYTFKKAKKISDSEWRVPTIEEMEELVKNCDYKWTTQNGVNGGLFTSKINGNFIFLPAAGYHDGSGVSGVGSYGNFWSSSASKNGCAYYLDFLNDNAYVIYYDRRKYGHSVRLVQDVK